MFKHQLCISAPKFTCLVSIHDGAVIKSQIDIEVCVKLSVNLDLLLDWWDAFALHLVMSLEFSATMNQLFYWLGESCSSSCVLTIFGEEGFGGLCSKNAAEDWGWDLSWRVLSSELWFCLTTLHFCYYATVPPVQRAWKIDLVLCIWVRESTSKSTYFCIFFYSFFFQHFLMLKLLTY